MLQMAKLGGIYISVRAKTDKYKRDLANAKTLTQKSAVVMKNAINNISFAQIGIAAAAVTAGLALMSREIVKAGVAADSLNRSFDAIFGSQSAATMQMEYVNEIAKELGLSLTVLENDYKNISAAARDTALEGTGVRKIFRAVAEASAVLGLSADDTSGTLRALSQMISKGTVQAEELRGQLGERLPGAFQLAAKAMGVTTRQLGKMLEQGQVLASDLLPKLADVLTEQYGKAAVDAGDSARAAFENFNTAVLELKRTLAESGITDFFAELARTSTNVLNIINKVVATTDLKDRIKVEIGLLEKEITTLETQHNKIAKSREEKHAESIKKMKEVEVESMRVMALKRSFMSKIPFVKEEVITQQERYVNKTDDLNKKLGVLKTQLADINALNRLGTSMAPIDDVVLVAPVLKLTEMEIDERNEKIDKKLDAYFKDIDYTVDVKIKIRTAMEKHNEALANDWKTTHERMYADTKLMSDKSSLTIYEYAQKAVKLGEETADAWTNAFDGWASNFSSTLTDMVWGAESSFKDIARSFGKMLTQMSIQIGIIDPISKLFKSGGSAGLGDFFKSMLSFDMFGGSTSYMASTGGGPGSFQPHFATGGMMGYDGTKKPFPAVVHSGEVIGTPNQMSDMYGDQKQGETQNNYTININALDSKSFDETMKRNPATFISIIDENIAGSGQLRDTIRGTL